jgi:aminoglycoside 6'-N-acetyltransferase I
MASAIAYVHPDKPLALIIHEVGVADRFQGQGIGGRLMRVLLEQGRTMGCTKAWVATEEDNVGARALYVSVGGTEDPVHAVVYTWSLAAHSCGEDGSSS